MNMIKISLFLYKQINTMLKDLVKKNRSYRRFYEDTKISDKLLLNFIDLARLSSSAKNNQPLKYHISNSSENNARIFETLAWAGYLKDWNGPIEGERPSAYIIVYLDKNIAENNYCDHGLAVQNILLGAVEAGFGGCIIAAFNRKIISEIVNVPDNVEPLLILALGKPKEKINIYEITPEEDIKYWRNSDNIHQVPKRKLEDILI